MACSAAPMRVTSLSGLISSIAASYSFCQFVSSMAAFPPLKNARTTLQDNKMFTPHLSRSEFRRRKKAFWPPTSKLESDWRFHERGFDPQSLLPLPTPHLCPLEQGNCRLL